MLLCLVENVVGIRCQSVIAQSELRRECKDTVQLRRCKSASRAIPARPNKILSTRQAAFHAVSIIDQVAARDDAVRIVAIACVTRSMSSLCIPTCSGNRTKQAAV